MAAGHGASVAIVEDLYFGGTCVNVGCVPKKLYVYASQFSESFSGAAGFGWNVDSQPTFDWPTLVANKTKEISRLQSVYDNLLHNSGVHVVSGRGTIIEAHTAKVADKIYSAEHIIVATGGWPFVPDVEGKEHIVTSNEIFNLPVLPKQMVIVGGGYMQWNLRASCMA